MPDRTTPSVYVASPLGFSDPGRHWYHGVLLPALTEREFSVLDPWAGRDELTAALELGTGPERDRRVGEARRAVAGRNLGLIRAADAVLAVLDGSDVDSGTAAEMGFALALNTPVFGLRTDSRGRGDHDAGTVNFQVEECIYATGGVIERDVPAVLDALAARLAGEHRTVPAAAPRPSPARARRGRFTRVGGDP